MNIHIGTYGSQRLPVSVVFEITSDDAAVLPKNLSEELERCQPSDGLKLLSILGAIWTLVQARADEHARALREATAEKDGSRAAPGPSFRVVKTMYRCDQCDCDVSEESALTCLEPACELRPHLGGDGHV